MATRKIRGSRVLLTGASSGIGRALALQLAAEGARQVLVARRRDRLGELAGQIAEQGGAVELVAGDVTEAETRQTAVGAVEAAYGGLDILVNNAGVGAMGRFEDGDPDRVRRVMEVNFFGPVALVRLALPLLKKSTRAMIVNVSSILGHRGVPHCAEYCASKFALQGFSESLRAELSVENVDVLVVSPGTTETEFFDSVIEHTSEPGWPKHKPVSAAYVARQTVRAIRKGKHEVIPYRWGKVLCWLNRLSPTLADHVVASYV